jgi:hypothetical protein
MTTIIEWAPFSLRPGVGEADLLHRSDRLQQEFLSRQAGFLRRELLRRGAGDYVDLVWWQSLEAARAAMDNVGASGACADYFALMPPDQGEAAAGVLHFWALRSYPAAAGS